MVTQSSAASAGPGRAGPALAAPLGVPIFLAAAAGLGYLLLLSGGPAWLPWLALAPAAAVAWMAMRVEAPPDGLAAPAVVGVGLLWAFGVFGAGDVLPPGDAIAVPQFARAIAGGRSLVEAFPPGSSGHAYPPGYPLLFAPLAAALPPAAALVAFRLLTVLVVGLIPAAWGWMHWTLFARKTPLWLVAAAAYVAFVAVERQLGFLTAFAGKNAVQFALLVFPAVMVATVRWAGGRWAWLLAAPALFGLFLIHYSMVHLAALFLAAYVLATGDWRRLTGVKMALAGAAAVGLLLAASGPALDDPRAASGAWTPGHAVAELGRQLVSAKPGVVIFHDGRFGLIPALFRLLVVAACGLFALEAGRRLRAPELWRPAAVYGMALAASLAVGYGVIPLKLSIDFMRCYAWALQAAVFLTAGLAAVALWPRVRVRWRWPAVAVLGLGAAAIAARDMQVEQRFFAKRMLAGAEIAEIADALPDRGPCFLIAASDARPSVLVTEQHLVAWNYAEAASACEFLTGSWVQPGVAGGRDLEGLPSAAALRSLPRGAAVFFVGDARGLTRYEAALRGQGLSRAWRPVDAEAGGGAVWRSSPQASTAM